MKIIKLRAVLCNRSNTKSKQTENKKKTHTLKEEVSDRAERKTQTFGRNDLGYLSTR